MSSYCFGLFSSKISMNEIIPIDKVVGKRIKIHFHLRVWWNPLVELNSNLLHEFLEIKFFKLIVLAYKACIFHLSSCTGPVNEVLRGEALHIIMALIFYEYKSCKPIHWVQIKV